MKTDRIYNYYIIFYTRKIDSEMSEVFVFCRITENWNASRWVSWTVQRHIYLDRNQQNTRKFKYLRQNQRWTNRSATEENLERSSKTRKQVSVYVRGIWILKMRLMLDALSDEREEKKPQTSFKKRIDSN